LVLQPEVKKAFLSWIIAHWEAERSDAIVEGGEDLSGDSDHYFGSEKIRKD
jgi:hypothetical protein